VALAVIVGNWQIVALVVIPLLLLTGTITATATTTTAATTTTTTTTTSPKKVPRYPLNRAGVDIVVEVKIHYFCRKSNPGPSSASPDHCTD
jgi:hypothetical protein